MKHENHNTRIGDAGETIDLKWSIKGVCAVQWYAYFYNTNDDRTYCVYLREENYWWTADLIFADGEYSAEAFEELPYEDQHIDSIPLAFYYDTDRDNSGAVVEDVLIYLKHRFPYLDFDSRIREKYDFSERAEDLGESDKGELLERRAALMRKYLEHYQEYISDGPRGK